MMEQDNRTLDLKRVQRLLLRMAKDVTGVLERHNIPYMMAYGTLIGSLRHKGFLPWDADFDLLLFNDTYDEALRWLRAELPPSLFVEDALSEPLYFHEWAHVKDLNTVAYCDQYPQDGAYAHKGVSIDLYRITRMKKRDVPGYLNEQNRLYIERRREKGLMSDEEYARRMETLHRNEASVPPPEEGDDRDVFARVTTYKCKFWEIGDILPVRKYVFEDTEFYGPHDADAMLRKIFGDYMQLPPAEQQVPQYSAVDFLEDARN